MQTIDALSKIAISVKSYRILNQLLNENPRLGNILKNSETETTLFEGIKTWVMEHMNLHPNALTYYTGETTGRNAFDQLIWSDYAAIRLLDYIDYSGRQIEDLNMRGVIVENNPLVLLWLAVKRGTGGAKPAFFIDMLHLFRQFSNKPKTLTSSKTIVEEWMGRHPSGIDPRIIKLREKNKERILKIIIEKMDRGEIHDTKYRFEPGLTKEQKFNEACNWWQDSRFHLKFAVRSPGMLNDLLGSSLDPDVLKILYDAERLGIPFFVNPYYLSLLDVETHEYDIGADLAIRSYVLYSRGLVDEFGRIAAWEKEDEVRHGEPNAAGWIIPYHNIHRRYPDVAILIPETMGRACGGLCASCQRMYGFQDGKLNFDLEELKPGEGWSARLDTLMEYFQNDSQLRDILITGGDALMSSDASIKKILDAIYEMAVQKKEANRERNKGEKYAEILRIRLGTRLPVYLPQRITPELVRILSEFREKALDIGIKQFVIQTHYETAMEVTPESRDAVKALISSGWIVTNQHVFTSASSRRGHTAKLRQVLNDIGVLTYYTFSVKGYLENRFNFATNARAVQEQMEEKFVGVIPETYYKEISLFAIDAKKVTENIDCLRKKANLPFLATDRNVLNLPGVGKSMTFRCIGLTSDGRRILEFDHDATRIHSPIIEKMGEMTLIESKSISAYLDQLEDMGENKEEYIDVFGYSIGETEPRMPIFEYPEYDFKITENFTNLDESVWK